MTNRAVTASSVHATLEDIGYESCNKHGTKPYWWMGPPKCPRCSALKNDNLIPRSQARELPQKPIRDSKDEDARKRGGRATGSQKKGVLTDEQVIEARDRYWLKNWSLSDLAKDYKVTVTTMSYAVNKQKAYKNVWYMPDKTQRAAHKKPYGTNCTPQEVKDIRKRNKVGESYDVLALEYGRTKQTIADICKRRTWKNI